MRHMLRFGWAAALGLALGGASLAQTTGGTGGTGGTGTGSGGTGGANSTTTPQTFLSTTALDSGVGATTTTSALNSANALSKYYANPLYQGRAGAAAGEAPGGFGTAMFSTTGGTTGGRTGATGGRTTGAAGGRTTTGGLGTTTGLGGQTGLGGGTTGLGAQGGRAGATGLGGQTGLGGGQTGFGAQGGRTGFGSTQQNTSLVIQQPRAIAYTSQLRFTTAPMTATRMQTEVRTVLDRSTVLSNPRGITVESDGAMVVLKGTVKDEDEARLVEGMIRLTPGVRDVKNELQFRGSQPTP